MSNAIENQLIYKVVNRDQWNDALEVGQFNGAPIDLTDGFIHFSTDQQLGETVRLHFAGQDNLMLVAVEASRLGEALKWEASRGGDLFPHLFAPLKFRDAVWTKDLPMSADGQHVIPTLS